MAAGFWQGMARDLAGPEKLRLLLQPTLAVLLGIRLGIADATKSKSKGKMPFFNRLVTEKGQRWMNVKASVSDAVLPLAVASIVDAILQHVTLGRIRLLPAIVAGTLLAWIPFVAARGLANRAWRHLRHATREQPA